MVNNIKTIKWDWPLISIEWIPEILKYFNYLFEPSWSAFYNLLAGELDNQTFSNRTFKQLKCFLLAFAIIEEKGKYLVLKVAPDKSEIKNHLKKIVLSSSEPWKNLFEYILTYNGFIDYQNLKNEYTLTWEKIRDYSVFKQWASLYQFIEMGIIVDRYIFYSISYLESNTTINIDLREKCLFHRGDPRILTYKFSNHSLADCLSFTRGENHIPFLDDGDSEGKYHFPKLTLKNNSDFWRSSLIRDINASISAWKCNIQDNLLKNNIKSLQKIILTSKLLIDYFLFGESKMFDDHLDYNHLMQIREKWEHEMSHKPNQKFWEALPKYYRDITRLYWGEKFFNNNLIRPIDEIDFEIDLVNLNDFPSYKELPIRSLKSKRTLKSIVSYNFIIMKIINKILNNGSLVLYEEKTKYLLHNLNEYFPQDPIERKVIVEKLFVLNMISEREKLILIEQTENRIILDIPASRTLQMAYWLHHYNRLKNNIYAQTVTNIQDRISLRIKQLQSEIRSFNKTDDKITELLKSIKEMINSERH